MPHFAARLYYGDPAVARLLHRVGSKGMQSPKFEAHLMRVFNMIGVLINSLQNEQLVEQLTNRLRREHQARRGMRPEYMMVYTQGAGC